jgi:hypothetical protein
MDKSHPRTLPAARLRVLASGALFGVIGKRSGDRQRELPITHRGLFG